METDARKKLLDQDQLEDQLMRRDCTFLLAFGLFAFMACEKTEPITPIDPNRISAADVVVVNEGNFQWGNASVSLYNSQTDEVLEEVFRNNNQDVPLGDVFQSMTQIGSTGYLVMNNSNHIKLVDLNTFKSLGRIDQLNSPRYMLPISQQKAYVSDLYEKAIYVVDLQAKQVVGSITAGGHTEEMILLNGRAFVTQVDSNEVLVIDTQQDSIIHRIKTAASPRYLELDKNQKLWVSCTGRGDQPSALLQINPSSLNIEKRLTDQSQAGFIGEIELSPNKEELYYLSHTGLKKISITDSLLSATDFISSQNRNIYGFSVNPSNGEIYLCDAIDFQQNGRIYQYAASGALLNDFSVGIIPGDVYFKP